MSDWTYPQLAVGILLTLAFGYVFTRVVSFAYFRTKLEHLRSVLRELNGGRRNGEK